MTRLLSDARDAIILADARQRREDLSCARPLPGEGSGVAAGASASRPAMPRPRVSGRSSSMTISSLLGRVIEKISAMPYPAFVGNTVLAPCGVSDKRIAG